jgi:hypothetical protein
VHLTVYWSSYPHCPKRNFGQTWQFSTQQNVKAFINVALGQGRKAALGQGPKRYRIHTGIATMAAAAPLLDIGQKRS